MDANMQLIRYTTFQSSQGMEFLLTLSNIAAFDRITAAMYSGECKLDESVYIMMMDIDGRMTDTMKAEVSLFFESISVSLPIFLLALETAPQPSTALELIESLKKQPALRLRQRCESIWMDLNKRGKADDGQKTWFMADRSADEMKFRLIQLLESFYIEIYCLFEDKADQYIRKTSMRLIALFNNDPATFYSSFLSLDPEHFNMKINIHVSCFLQTSILLLHPQTSNAPAWIAVGGSIEEIKNAIESDIKQTTLKFFKLLSDKTRYEIIQLLNKKPWYNEELANHIGVSPATVNYHLAAMLDLDIVSMVREQHRMYYSLNIVKLDQLFIQIRRGILGDNNSISEENKHEE